MNNSYRTGLAISARILLALSSALLLFMSTSVFGQDAEAMEAVADSLTDTLSTVPVPAAPAAITAADTPDDAGGSISVRWEASPDDHDGGIVDGYLVLRAEVIDGQAGEFKEVGDVAAGAAEYSSEDGNVVDGHSYVYQVVAFNNYYDANSDLQRTLSESETSAPASSSAQWFNKQRTNVLVATLLLCIFIIYYISQAKSGKSLFIRKIAGLEAIDEAVGRATEMGRKIFYVPGIGDMDNMMTIAAITILGRVAELAAQYETYLDVPVCRSMVMVTAREVVKEAHSKVGRPDSYKEDQVHYLTDDQFGYAAGVDGMVVREKPATIFLMGQFFAESLILAETGNSIGAIQIAGTAMPSQLPFFVASCDYTLIGEELFAASAYLSKEPKLLGSLKGQDVGKAMILIAIILGIILETAGIFQLSNLFTVIGD
ncbi:MAG TPA: fibronectin type III domain-containing protein [candidate division Zixibacteria bacterium]|nr:fibronectin type III domain-containing protein [candidate division Zixibacteria bacterium]